MWVITTNGFVSLVEHNQKADVIRARARRVEHLADTFDLDTADIIDLGPNCPDYRYHADIPRLLVAQKMYDAVMDVGYTSHVKESVARDDAVFYRAMMGCWRELYTLQYPAKSGMVLDQESLLAGTGRWGEQGGWLDDNDDIPSLDSMGGIVGQIEELADKMRGMRPHGYVVDELKDDDDVGAWNEPTYGVLPMLVWAGMPDDCLICGEQLRLGDHYVDLPEDVEFEEPAGPAHAGCAEDEGWEVQR